MGKLIKPRFRLNRYSWSIITAFTCTAFAMQYHTASISYNEFLQVTPLIFFAIYWCQKSAHLITHNGNLKKTELFKRDLFLLNFSFFLATLISLALAYGNSDARSWWVFIVYFYALYGLIFSLIFSVMALLIKKHKTYTMFFACLIIILISFIRIFPHYTKLPLLGIVDTFFVITGSILIVHSLFAIGCKMTELFFRSKGATLRRNRRT